MSEFDVQEYLLSHAPLDQFYIFIPPGGAGPLVKFFDDMGMSWNLMEDDDGAVAQVVKFLKCRGVKTFEDYEDLLEFERSEGTSAPH
ncbi:hypothetical protein N8I74_14520 [Chitiniphilus purpureus]|uniref:Uncharacterized protein n=1 Tax=Chitiniphilus purpureus TaxID=2981137 RepID=A0ABY6DJV8_9NEIS|nr:hypothetical protein [Chitiniphilus sp. CD1]UXY14523.1 hypothetical protein N8I74_14520 [Chitiniphilus sp. CD1]